MGNPLSIRLSDDERAALDRAAREAGLSTSAYVRGLIRSEAGFDEGPEDERLTDFEKRLARLEEMAGL